MPTAKEICDSIGDRSLLDSTVEDIHLDNLAREMTEWREIAPRLEITPPEEEEIVEKHQGNLRLQKREALRKWKEEQGTKASYRRLIAIFCAEGKVDLAETVKRLLTTKRKGSHSDLTAPPTNVIDDFHYYLGECYSELPNQPPSSLPWPNSASNNLRYVELDLLDVPVSDTHDNIEHGKRIELSSLFTVGNTKAKRKVILIEGIAGAGKTTLSWYACRKWVGGNLFKDIKLLIHVSLSDPAIHSATKLADLIPHHNERMRAAIAEAIIETRGKKVCFWFDGCDEAPPLLWELFLFQFVAGSGGKATLPNANIILTSRPQVTVKLTTILTGKVIVRGFQSLQQFVTACLPDNGDQLLEALDLKPELYSLCHLPLNAAILVYLYDTFKDNLPSTRTGLFHPLVSNFVVRHMLTRTSYTHADVTNFPANLPDDIRSSFANITKLAYTSLLQRKMVTDRSMLTECGISTVDDAFGFIIARLKFTMCGPADQFVFTHSSLQEFLAAFHVSKMDEDKQVRAIRRIFDQNPNSPVLAFFAGLNGLVVEEIRQMFFKMLISPCGITDVVNKLRLAEGHSEVNLSDDPRRRLLCLMNCLYEAQNPEFFTQVTLIMSDSDVIDLVHGRTNCKEIFMTFSFMYLYPTDYLSLGYFLRHANVKTRWVCLDLSHALIGDREIRALAQELCKPARSNILYLNICGIPISINSLHSLKTIFHSESCLFGLEFDNRHISDIYLAMKYIVEGLSRSHCRRLMMGCCSFKIIHYLLLLLYPPVKINVLDLSYSFSLFIPPGAMCVFCEAMKYSKLKWLMLNACGINDESLMVLASAICHEQSCFLERLEIEINPYTDDGLTGFFKLMLERISFVRLVIMSVNDVNDKHRKLIDEINTYRRRWNWICPKLSVVSCAAEPYSQNKQFQDRRKGYKILSMRPDLAFQPPHH